MDKFCVIIPSYNPSQRLVTVVKKLLAQGVSECVIVNDGSRQDTQQYFDQIAGLQGVTLLVHPDNKGKGAALKTAFSYCLENKKDLSGVVTADDDEQHTIEDIIRCGEQMQRQCDSIVLGVRDFKDKATPRKNALGNRITSLVFRLLFGMRISDTQTGLRAIPYDYLPFLEEVKGEGFEYESNALLEMKKNNIPYQELTIKTVYLDNNSSTHFHALFDSVKIYGVILKFFFSSLLSAGTDLVIFTLLNLLLHAMGTSTSLSLLLSTVAARILSSIVNFNFNRMTVFHSHEPLKKAIVKYYLLCAAIMLISFGGVYLFSNLLGAGTLTQTAIKVAVDTILFFVSFSIQEKWVFKKTKG